MAALFDLEIHTPYRLFFNGKAEVIIITLMDGDIGIYAGHSPFTAPSKSCILRIKDEKGMWRCAFVSGGILEIKDQYKFKNVLLVEAAQWPQEIDRERALDAKKQAEEKLKTVQLKFEIDETREKLRRTELRLKTWELRNK